MMSRLKYNWQAEDSEHEFELAHVPGTNGKPFLFGREPNRQTIEVSEFYVSTTPVTQGLWSHVMGSNPAVGKKDPFYPVENVSWNDVISSGGFLDRINESEILESFRDDNRHLRFRLPSETEWEYAARGGPRWTDEFVYSGSNDPNKVAWYGRRWTRAHDLAAKVFGWRFAWYGLGRLQRKVPTRTHKVALKAPNQLGIYDMSGNVWEWCQDVCVDEVSQVPADGSPYPGPGDERRLRGGCHHNWNLHCTVSWRYGIEPSAHDGCIGFRVVLGP